MPLVHYIVTVLVFTIVSTQNTSLSFCNLLLWYIVMYICWISHPFDAGLNFKENPSFYLDLWYKNRKSVTVKTWQEILLSHYFKSESGFLTLKCIRMSLKELNSVIFKVLIWCFGVKVFGKCHCVVAWVYSVISKFVTHQQMRKWLS